MCAFMYPVVNPCSRYRQVDGCSHKKVFDKFLTGGKEMINILQPVNCLKQPHGYWESRKKGTGKFCSHNFNQRYRWASIKTLMKCWAFVPK
jgi:hypothetical protein